MSAEEAISRVIVGVKADLRDFDPIEAITLAQACDEELTGRGGKPLSIQMGQRYAREGYRIPGGGPRLILPTVWWSGGRRLMRSWARAFEQERARLCALWGVRVD